MGRVHELAPLKEQDRLKKNLLKTKEGNYIKITNASVWIEGEEELTSRDQDSLEEGLIRLFNGSYYHIESIEWVEESDCFVATVVYGNTTAPQVETLRRVRDEKLKPNRFGRAFIDVYYGGLGRKVADFLRKQPLATNLVRNGLDFVVRRYSPDL